MDRRLDGQTHHAPRGLHGRRWLVVALALALLVGCGDERLFRLHSDEEPVDEVEQPDDDRPDELVEFETWYEEQDPDVMRVPWSYQLDEETVEDAIIEEDRLSWPLPEYEHMTRWTRNDVLWAPVDDPTRSFLRRALSVEVTDEQVVFHTRNAGFQDLFFKANIDVSSERTQQLIPGVEQPVDTSELSTREQDLYYEANDFEHLIGLGGSVKFGFCASAGGSGFEACSSADISCPPDSNQGNDVCDDYEHKPGADVAPVSGSVDWGVFLEWEPRFRVSVDRFYFVQDIDDNVFWDPGGRACRCLARHYSEDVGDVADQCGLSVDDVVEAKGDCMGSNSFLNIELAGGMSVEFRNLTLRAFQAMGISKEYQLFQSVPLPLGSTGITLQLTASLTPAFDFDVEGAMHWKDAAHGPRFGFDFGVGVIYPEDAELGNFYQVAHGNENSTDVPAPTFDLTGSMSTSVTLEVGLLAKFAGMLGVSLDIGGKAEAGVEGGGSVDTGTGDGTPACKAFFNLGGTLGVTALATLGFWSAERSWSIFDTCADPEDNLFNLDMSLACYTWERDFCEADDSTANHVRLTTSDPHVGGYPDFAAPEERKDPYGLEIDAIWAMRDDQMIMPTSVVGGSAAGLSSVDFNHCDWDAWESSVGIFQSELIVAFAEPLKPGDQLFIYRQGFPKSVGHEGSDGTTMVCHPSGSFDVQVGTNGSGWGSAVATQVEPDSNMHQFELSSSSFPD